MALSADEITRFHDTGLSFPHRVISVMFVIRITPPLITHYLRPTNQSYRWHASVTFAQAIEAGVENGRK